MLRSAAEDATSARLPGGFALRDVAPARRITELGFCRRSRAFDAHRLNAFLRAEGLRVPSLDFAGLQGYLNGFIDLVFEHGGRWYVLDWKSNRLGVTADDYGPAAVDEAMAAHGYALQALIYLLALHRWLGRRLPGYRWETHMGGAVYLFVRAMRPDWALPDGGRRGIWQLCPTRETIEAFGRIVDETASEVA
jgi:exodeoxyribonuclease V beta subunit